MVTVIVLLPGRADRGQEEFRRYLDEKHLPLVKRLPGLQRLVVDHAMPASSPPHPPPMRSPGTGSKARRPCRPSRLAARAGGLRRYPETSPTLTG